MMMACCRLIVIFLLTNMNVCESCDSINLYTWAGTDPAYRDAAAPENASESLLTCGRWCIENHNCVLLTWSPGSCWQVDRCGTQVVTETVYDLKRDRAGWYLNL